MPPPHNLADETNRFNELASNIHTIADARRLIDAIADLFADDLPPAWTTESLRARLAQAEYLTVTNPQKRITEQHLAESWNTYLTTIHAPDDSQVSVAEIHILRNTHFTSGRQMWNRGYRNFWMLPSIFAAQPDGTLAPACRLVESLRMLYDLDRFPQNLRGIRENLRASSERARNAATNSAPANQSQQSPSSTPAVHAYLEMRAATNREQGIPYNSAEAAAMRERSMRALTNTIETMLNSIMDS